MTNSLSEPVSVTAAGGVEAVAAVYNDLASYPTTDACCRAFGWTRRVWHKNVAHCRKNHPHLFVIDRHALRAQELSRMNRQATAGGIAPGLRLRPANVADASFGVPVPNAPEDIQELWDRRRKQFARVRETNEFLRLVQVHIHLDGPVGVLHIGDPHVDDDGTDVEALLRHAELVRETEGLWAGNVGDTQNNWIGRLARLYGSQSTSEQESLLLAESWLRSFTDADGRTKWLYLIGGNHDVWHGDTRDPVRWISSQMGAMYQSSEVRIRLNLPSGRACTINARHDFNGSSMWNPAHAPGKAVQMGEWDDITICGHRHVSGYMILRNPQDGRICHALRVASYKVYDRYAREKGFRDQRISPAVLTIIDPYAQDEAGFVTVWHDIEAGVRYLRFLREEWKQRAAA